MNLNKIIFKNKSLFNIHTGLDFLPAVLMLWPVMGELSLATLR
jgi:hypothetical protein